MRKASSKADAEPLHTIAHRLIHCQIGARKRIIIQLQLTVLEVNLAALEFK